MQVLATGKWIKEEKRWATVVAIQRPVRAAGESRRKRPKSQK